MRVTTRAMLGIVLLFSNSCVPLIRQVDPKHPDLAFFRLPLKEQKQRILEMPPERRVELYVFGAVQLIPPVDSLAGVLVASKDARDLLPEIERRLATSLDDTELFELIKLLRDMTVAGVDLREEEELWEAIDRAVDWISAPYEDKVGRKVDAIRAGPPEP